MYKATILLSATLLSTAFHLLGSEECPPPYKEDSVSLPGYDSVNSLPLVTHQPAVTRQAPPIVHEEVDQEAVSKYSCLELLGAVCCIGCEQTARGRRACVLDGSCYVDKLCACGQCTSRILDRCQVSCRLGVQNLFWGVKNYCCKPLCCVTPGKDAAWYWGCAACLCVIDGFNRKVAASEEECCSGKKDRDCCRGSKGWCCCCYSCECGPNVVPGFSKDEDGVTCLEIGCGKDALIGHQEPLICCGLKCVCTGCPLQAIDRSVTI